MMEMRVFIDQTHHLPVVEAFRVIRQDSPCPMGIIDMVRRTIETTLKEDASMRYLEISNIPSCPVRVVITPRRSYSDIVIAHPPP